MADETTAPDAEPAEQTPDTGTEPTTPDPQTAEPDADAEGNDRAHRQAARYRTERNELQQQLQAAQQAQADTLARIGEALGLTPEAGEQADPAAQVGALTGQVENLTAENAALRAELQVHTLAGEHGANPVALLDSRAFLSKLNGLDQSAEDYGTQVAEAIKDAVSSNANLRAAGQGPARGGAPGAGQGSAQPDGAVTAEQFAGMSYRDKSELFRNNPDLYRRLAGN